jgi:hypothetical protein
MRAEFGSLKLGSNTALLGGVFGGVRHLFFSPTWKAALSKILSLDNVRKQHIIVIDWCCLCKKSVETVGHLLLHCELASAL